MSAPPSASLESVTGQVSAWREACLDLPFEKVTDMVHFTGTEIRDRLENPADPFRWFLIQASAYVTFDRTHPMSAASIDPLEVVGFTAFAGAVASR